MGPNAAKNWNAVSSQAGDPLERLLSVLDFETFGSDLDAALNRTEGAKRGRPALIRLFASSLGRIAFTGSLFKVLVLQTLYDLSDAQAEFQFLDRGSFGQFLNLDAGGRARLLGDLLHMCQPGNGRALDTEARAQEAVPRQIGHDRNCHTDLRVLITYLLADRRSQSNLLIRNVDQRFGVRQGHSNHWRDYRLLRKRSATGANRFPSRAFPLETSVKL